MEVAGRPSVVPMDLKNQVIQRRSQIVNNISRDKSKVKGRVLVDMNSHDIAGALRVQFRVGDVVAIGIPDNFIEHRLEIREMVPCTLNPSKNALRWAKTHQEVTSSHARRQQVETKDREGPRDTGTHAGGILP